MLIYFQDDLLYSLYSTAQYWDYETRLAPSLDDGFCLAIGDCQQTSLGLNANLSNCNTMQKGMQNANRNAIEMHSIMQNNVIY